MNKTDLAAEIEYLLQIPKAYNHKPMSSEAGKILNTILTVIVDALWRGEEVRVAGFGIFRVRTRKSIKNLNNYWRSSRGVKRSGPRILTTYKPKKYVWFEPSKVLLGMLNDNQEEIEQESQIES